MNRSPCNACGALVPCERAERDGQVFLVKDCPDCGTTDTLIAADAERYNTKRKLDGEHDEEAKGCTLNCLTCGRKNQPGFIFVDITNRCNSNCPICINNTPSMGFLFEPPLEYFDKIFAHFSKLAPKPTVQLFGGEPTVRKDLFEIIEMGRSYGLRMRVVTNGLTMANEDYCRKLVESRATLLMAYDGCNTETYRVLRGTEKYLDIKKKALDNVAKIGKAKVALMTCVAKGFNDDEIPELVEFCHDRRDFIRGVYFMPLAETWAEDALDVHPPRMTTEDLEMIFNDAFPDERIDFIPAGVLGELTAIMDCLGANPPPFAGAHPNCESMYILVSDGEKYMPIARYLKGTLPDLIEALLAADQRVAARVERLERSLFGRILDKLHLKKRYLKLRAMLTLAGTLRRNMRMGFILKGRGLGKVWHALAIPLSMMVGVRSRKVFARHTTWQGQLQVIVLPFEDSSTLETERLERCPNAFVYYDPETDRANHVPVCSWGRHKTAVMKRIAKYYGEEVPEEAPVAG